MVKELPSLVRWVVAEPSVDSSVWLQDLQTQSHILHVCITLVGRPPISSEALAMALALRVAWLACDQLLCSTVGLSRAIYPVCPNIWLCLSVISIGILPDRYMY